MQRHGHPTPFPSLVGAPPNRPPVKNKKTRAVWDVERTKTNVIAGSDAFSGITANPLLAWVARELVRHGGSALLAETDELIGAEAHVLKSVRDVETARWLASWIYSVPKRPWVFRVLLVSVLRGGRGSLRFLRNWTG